jgi:cephalosporin hydroxylase
MKLSSNIHPVVLRLLSIQWMHRLIIDCFHLLFYGAVGYTQSWKKRTWLGIPILKNPLDLWILQEIFWKVKPDFIIETGTFMGGSAYYMASLCDQIKHGQILTIDSQPQNLLPEHERITYLTGSSTSDKIISQVKEKVSGASSILVILDSNHQREHVLTELRLYHTLVTIGSYLIVEDTNVNGHPVFPTFGPGPGEAVSIFMRETSNFVVDPVENQLLFTFNPGGFLRRIG